MTGIVEVDHWTIVILWQFGISVATTFTCYSTLSFLVNKTKLGQEADPTLGVSEFDRTRKLTKTMGSLKWRNLKEEEQHSRRKRISKESLGHLRPTEVRCCPFVCSAFISHLTEKLQITNRNVISLLFYDKKWVWNSVRGRSPKIDRTDLDRGHSKSTDRGRLFGRNRPCFSVKSLLTFRPKFNRYYVKLIWHKPK